ncbi:protein RER1A-like isoform X2 [Solanum dulcamara]|uniref:protein RER1A-like isoform X2 n=1 Tax=Solanum dulcamara TaxID=45834 RepID=UPI00248522D1|nr:protein RER1A-like isoform X2 [Solanum dulcamara]
MDNSDGAASAAGDASPSAFTQLTSSASRSFQHFLDKTTPYLLYRWIAFFFIAVLYVVRVYVVEGFYVISYALGIYILNLLIGFLSPQVDPEFQDLSDGPTLPTRETDEFRPFVRRLPEFKFWYSITKAFCIAFVLTFFSVLDVPVFWPILLFYWVVLFTLTMRRQIRHMLKYKYLPFSFGKQRYDGKETASSESEDLLP